MKPAGAGIERPIGALRLGRSGHFGTGAAAGVEQPGPAQGIGGGFIGCNAPRLRSHLAPGEAEPGEVGAEGFGQLGPAARAVDILDPQQERAARCPRAIVRDDRGPGMAEMQRPVGAGGKAGDDLGGDGHGGDGHGGDG
jgi:hypothetical protein